MLDELRLRACGRSYLSGKAKSGVLESPTMALEHNYIFAKLQWFVLWGNLGTGIYVMRDRMWGTGYAPKEGWS